MRNTVQIRTDYFNLLNKYNELLAERERLAKELKWAQEVYEISIGERERLVADIAMMKAANDSIMDNLHAERMRVANLLAVKLAAEEYATFDDLRGDLCDQCKPPEPEAFITARERLADALDDLARGQEGT